LAPRPKRWHTERVSVPYPIEALAGVRVRGAALRRAWPLAIAIIVIAAIGSGLTCSQHGRPALASALFLPDMLVDLPVRPVTWLTPDPLVERTTIDYGSGGIVTDIYRPPGGGRHAAIIFSMGAPPLDLDDSRLVKLAEDAARAGLVMAVPFSERLDRERLEPEEIDALVGIFAYLEEQPYVDPERIGYIGVSVGGSLALVAAADERVAERVDYVVAFGAYFDAIDTLSAIGARRATYDGLDEPWAPDPHTIEVMALQLIEELPDADDRATLCRLFVDPWDRMVLCDPPVGREPPTGDELLALTPTGEAAYALMSGDPTGADALLDVLPPSTREKLERLSPNRVIQRLQAELYIIHDRGDEFIPYVESRRMRDALAGRAGVHFTEVSLFEHVEPRLSRGGDVIVLDGVRLYFRLYQLLLRLT
jgi:acetyl esterase/lipase